MYVLVVDVERYFEFLFWNSVVWIWLCKFGLDGSEVVEVDLVISFKVFCECFGSCVMLWFDQKCIDIEYLDGLFKYLKSGWSFVDMFEGCKVDFFVDFEFCNVIFGKVIGVVFGEVMICIVCVFEDCVCVFYGEVRC